MRTTVLLALLTMLLAAPRAADACTTFLLRGDGGPVVGKSYDWDNGLGLVIANRRGVAKQGLPATFGEATAQWVSRYASVTFNQYGQELPNGGMNEKGLVVEIMWLNESSYPAKDARPSLNELQWIQYHLDIHATVAEVVASAPKLRVAPAYAKVHYMACDAGGACATFEYIGGELVVHEGKDLPAAALTNHPYDESVEYLKKVGTGAAPEGRGSLPRFARAAKAVEIKEKGGLKERAFKLLDAVSQGSYTKWNIVYDPKNLRLHFRTYEAKSLKSLNVGELAATCKQEAVALDLNDRALEGDITKSLTAMTLQRNRDLVKKSLAALGGTLPAPLVEALVVYPRTLRCTVE